MLRKRFIVLIAQWATKKMIHVHERPLKASSSVFSPVISEEAFCYRQVTNQERWEPNLWVSGQSQPFFYPYIPSHILHFHYSLSFFIFPVSTWKTFLVGFSDRMKTYSITIFRHPYIFLLLWDTLENLQLWSRCYVLMAIINTIR